MGSSNSSSFPQLECLVMLPFIYSLALLPMNISPMFISAPICLVLLDLLYSLSRPPSSNLFSSDLQIPSSAVLREYLQKLYYCPSTSSSPCSLPYKPIESLEKVFLAFIALLNLSCSNCRCLSKIPISTSAIMSFTFSSYCLSSLNYCCLASR